MSQDCSAMVLERVVHVKWNPHDVQGPKFSYRTVHCDKMIIVIHFIYHSKLLGLGWIFAH